MDLIPSRLTADGRVVEVSSVCAAHKLNRDQSVAFTRIVRFLADPNEHFFVLRGFAGTGKTYLMRVLGSALDSGGIVYTSPTNKATKVLRRTLDLPGSSCKTIYSLLGIKMVAEGEFLTLEFPHKPVDISVWKLIVLDEASMLNTQLYQYIKDRARESGAKFLFVGDSAQLPPVGEAVSPVWRLKCAKASLEQVMRFDNELLDFATHVRTQIQAWPKTKLLLKASHGPSEGVWVLNREKWLNNIRKCVKLGLFKTPDHTKVIAWRNKSVNDINCLVRAEIHGPAHKDNYLVGDRVIISEPVQMGGVVVAHVDDEGTVVDRYISAHTYHPALSTYHLTVQFDEGRTINLYVIHEDSEADLQVELSALAAAARKDKFKWKAFWALRNTFHRIKYSYALTAHRAQGSTYVNTFLDSTDILSNRNRLESLQCFYVGCTRATTKLLLS